ncbi:hypothetical protein L596_027275 [Steinernema carpocapsae]|uniref:Secreted protein n=1 Tax=Steinernema carpocapsae TaxID=34508 RepID=A0A4U5M563_STECR|nr:hypothetical protein L596_027275 [Steinernema carpocapsae]
MPRLSLLAISFFYLVPLASSGNIFYSDGVKHCPSLDPQLRGRPQKCEEANLPGFLPSSLSFFSPFCVCSSALLSVL